MTLQISMLEEVVQRLHVRLQRQIRALYVLHSNGNDEAALVALDRIAQINTKIAELNALLDSFEQAPIAPATTGAELVERLSETPLEPLVEDVIIDDPDQDDIEIEYRSSIVAAVLLILVAIVAMLGWHYGRQFLGNAEGIKQTAVQSATEAPRPAVVAPSPPTNVTVADVATVTYIVQKGDTLWSIATQQLGDGSTWGTVYGQNVDIIGDNPDLIFPGQVLTITKVSIGSETIG